MGRIEEAEGDSVLIRRPAVSTNLDSMELPESELPTTHHTQPDLRPLFIYSRGVPGLASVEEDAPNPVET